MYELMVIAKADGADGEVDKYLKDAVAENVNKQSLGKKQLAYPIKKIAEAEYFLWTFEAPGAAILALDTKLRLEQDLVLRHLLTVFDPKKAAKAGRVSSVDKFFSEKSEVSRVSRAEQKAEEPKAKPKVTVTTKIVGVKKEVAKEPKETKEPKEAKGKVKAKKK